MVLPDEIKLLLAAGMVFFVTEGLKVVGSWFGKDLTGLAAGVAAALTGAIVVFSNGLLAQVPAEYQQIVVAVFSLIGLLLGAFGVHGVRKQFLEK